MHIQKHIELSRPSITEDQITEMTVGMMIDSKKTAPASECITGAGRVVLEIIYMKAETAIAICATIGIKWHG
ncbi:MAG: hypothetical protein ACLSCV_03245 [Acutalibacteraceae bacterium]